MHFLFKNTFKSGRMTSDNLSAINFYKKKKLGQK